MTETKERLMVDCVEGDNSSVFHRASLTEDAATHFSKEWLFDTDDGTLQFDTEEEACAAQRDYRERHGFDPITGAAH